MPTLVDKEDLPNAVALNSIQFNLARVIGPVLAGVAFYRLGAAACFGLNALSFLAPIAALLVLTRGGIDRKADRERAAEPEDGPARRARSEVAARPRRASRSSEASAPSRS